MNTVANHCLHDRRIEEIEDAELIRRIIEGDVNSFEPLVARYSPFVHSVVSRHVPGDRVSEVAQDVFVSAYRTLPSYSGRGGFKQWLRRIAVRRCCDFWRESKRRPETPFSQLSDEHVKWIEGLPASGFSDTARSAVAGIEAKEILDIALAGLSAKDRTALTLVYLEDMPVKEAAELLGWSSVLLRVRVHRAKGALRKIISKLLEMRDQDEK